MTVPEIPGFAILKQIGRGGMGEIFLARQLNLGRLVAIKFLRPEEPLEGENDTLRFRREAELMAKVSHPNILSIFDFGEADGYCYLVVEYAEGGDLRHRMTPGEPMPIDQVRSLISEVGKGLEHLHKQGIVHRDLKPENILLNEDGRPIVSDFGISILWAGNEALTRTGRGPGTLGYIAPEQHYGLKVDERADQYSLAALTYEMLTGQLPLGLFKPPSLLNPRLSPQVDKVILKALKEEARDRFATIGEFLSGLDQALAATGSSALRPILLRSAWAAISLLALAGILLGSLARPPRPQGKPGVIDGRPRALGPADDDQVMSAATEELLLEAIKKRRAHQIWQGRGSPSGEEGKAAQESIWFEAERTIQLEIEQRAYQFWLESGKPDGQAGLEAIPVNRAKAIRHLYRKATGDDPPRP